MSVSHRFIRPRFIASRAMPLLLVWLLITLAVPPRSVTGLFDADAGEPDRAVIEQHMNTLNRANVRATPEGIKGVLAEVITTAQSNAAVEALIKQLGSDDFDEREAAERAIRRMPTFPYQAVLRAQESSDAEIAYRAKALLRDAKQSGPSEVVVAALAIARVQHMRGLIDSLLDAMPHFDDTLHADALATIEACATKEDWPALRKALDAMSADVRRAAVAGLAPFAKEGSLDWIAPRMKDEDIAVRFDAARACLNGGNRESLAVFVDLLNSEDIASRAKAAAILQAVSGERFDFVAYDDEDKRKAAIDKWRQWLAKDAATAKLQIPLPSHPTFVGRIIVAGYSRGTIVELDMQGKLIREFSIPGLQYPWGAQRLPNGHTLITWYSHQFVAEYDKDNKEVWRYNTQGNYPWKSLRLDNGNTLLTMGSKALEVDRKGNEVWSHTFARGSLTDVTRLANGNTLALMSGFVTEVDRTGRIVWELEGINGGYRIQRLPNGNTLIAERSQSRVVEFNHEKQQVATFNKVPTPDCTQRLPDGRLLVSGGGGVHLFSKSGELIWKYDLPGQSVARYY